MTKSVDGTNETIIIPNTIYKIFSSESPCCANRASGMEGLIFIPTLSAISKTAMPKVRVKSKPRSGPTLMANYSCGRSSGKYQSTSEVTLGEDTGVDYKPQIQTSSQI